MIMKKAILPILLSVLVVPAFVSRASAQTADEVVDKYLAALGGKEALGKLTSRRAIGTITVATQVGDLGGPIEIDTKLPNKGRVAIDLDLSAVGGDKMHQERKFDGTSGWTLNSMNGDAEITGNELDNLRNNVFPTPLLNYKTSGLKMEVLPKETLNGTAVVVLRATPKAGSATKLYFDAATYLLLRTVTTVNSAETGGDIEQTSDLADYRAVDGIKVPFQITNSNPLQSAVIKLTKVEHNVALDDALFKAKSPAAR
jgi:outer membrane lipoprotein-sorting protein